ncbi:hypothetical protein RJ639_010040 [Escallonia herrerae]|uniref:FAR1 domain-containing protein n=1 Tax=Escallonia herrerae TaxID=1293975 RepID=A0AA88VTN6_9ASTE|nr:hypothetical protein RJ639_010040 [Escallonia herrerae]
MAIVGDEFDDTTCSSLEFEGVITATAGGRATVTASTVVAVATVGSAANAGDNFCRYMSKRNVKTLLKEKQKSTKQKSESDLRTTYVSVKLANKAGEIIVLKVLGKQISGEFSRTPHDESRTVLASRNQVIKRRIVHELLIEQIDVNECLTDHDILDTHVHDELETVDYDVWGLSHCNDEVETRKENETYESFEDFKSEHVARKTFDTQEATYEFYNQHALLNGFGTRKHNAHKIMATGAIFRRQFVCNKQGFKKLDDKRLNGNEKRRRDLRTGCEVIMQVTMSKKL